MNTVFRFGYWWRKYPLFRFFLILFAFAAAAGCAVGISLYFNRVPHIDKIEPAVGMPGDVLTVSGACFGDERNTGFVEIGGSRQTASSYIEWTDTLIRLVLPSNVRDGLVFVQTEAGRSEGKLFANKADIPVPVPEDITTSLPSVASLSETAAAPGELISIYGTNFGSVRGSGAVYFACGRDMTADNTAASYIACSDVDYDYEYWSNTEIRVRVPDGAVSGNVFVTTSKGNSNAQKLRVESPSGEKVFSHKRTYLLQLSVDIAQIAAQDGSSMLLRLPRPLELPYQPAVEVTECFPEPLLADYDDMIIYHEVIGPGADAEQFFFANYAVTTYAVSANIDAADVETRYDTERLLYQAGTESDALVQSADPRITALCGQVLSGVGANPYRQARVLYDYLIDTYTLLPETRGGEISVFDMLETGAGDAYDFTLLYCMLLRAAGIPCMPLGGILIDSSLAASAHWWCEFYLEEFGWVPVDIALGAGLPFDGPLPQEQPARDFYFGSVDAQRVVFSRGWKEIKPSAADSKTVAFPRSFALQSIWEEASAQTESYSSFWNGPYVLGLY